MDQICVLYGKYIWEFYLRIFFVYEKWKFLEIWYFVLQVWINEIKCLTLVPMVESMGYNCWHFYDPNQGVIIVDIIWP